MTFLLHHLVEDMAARSGDAAALMDRQNTVTYADLWENVRTLAGGLQRFGFGRHQRMAVYLDKCKETVVSFLSASVRQTTIFSATATTSKPHLPFAPSSHILTRHLDDPITISRCTIIRWSSVDLYCVRQHYSAAKLLQYIRRTA